MEVQPMRLYKLEEVAEILGLHIASVQRLCRTGKLRSKQVGRRYYVLGRDLLPEGFGKGKGQAVE